MYEVKIEDEGRGIKKRNGAVARANAEDLSLLLYQLLEQGSWEAVKVGSTVNIIPLNLAPKQGAKPPWRLIVNAIEVNEHVVGKWPCRYEGLQTLPMVVSEGCSGLAMDLKDGYYACWLQEESR